MALPKTVEWVFSVSAEEALELLRNGLAKMEGHTGLSDSDASTLSAKTPKWGKWWTGVNRPTAEWRIIVSRTKQGSKARLTVEARNQHEVLLDELARFCGDAVTSREKPPGNWAAARAVQEAKAAAREAEMEAKIGQQAEGEPTASEKLSARLQAHSAKLEEKAELAARRVMVSGMDNVIADFDGVETITLHRGFRKKTYLVDEHVGATVESGGNLRTHPTLTRTAAGFAVTGTPIGAASWKKQGSLFLLIDGQDWAELIELKPKKAATAQKFAQQVNLAARMAQEAPGASEPAPAVSAGGGVSAGDPSTVIEQLERLTKLREQGALTDEEFEAQKRRILNP